MRAQGRRSHRPTSTAASVTGFRHVRDPRFRIHEKRKDTEQDSGCDGIGSFRQMMPDPEDHTECERSAIHVVEDIPDLVRRLHEELVEHHQRADDDC